ncbi:MAG: hypothetical protein DGJ47_000263 [Rickettsiaceae bacterium]
MTFNQNNNNKMELNKQNTPASEKSSSFFEEIKSLFLIVMCALLIRTFVLEIFHIPTGSMKASILEGDYIFSTKYDYGFSKYSFPFSPNIFQGRIFKTEPTPGDVIIMRPPHNMQQRYIKRLIAIPGDKVQIIDNLIYINDKPITRKREGSFVTDQGYELQRFKETLPSGISYYTYKSTEPNANPFIDRDNFGPYYVESDRYFFLGDNRDNSGDSRYQLGTVPSENFIAKGHFVFFSAKLILWDATTSFTEQIARVWYWIKSIRLKRTFTSLYEA